MKKIKAAMFIGLVWFAFPLFAQFDADNNGAYHNYAETAAMLQELAGRYPDLAQLVSIGRSVEGRELNL